jgi:hypothetical protein
MARGPEGLLVAAIVREVRANWPEAWTFKVHGNPYQAAGAPDLLVIVRGLLVGIEVKARRRGESYAHAMERVTLRQWSRIEDLRRAGATAGPALSVDEAVALVRHALGEAVVSNAGLPRPV